MQVCVREPQIYALATSLLRERLSPRKFAVDQRIAILWHCRVPPSMRQLSTASQVFSLLPRPPPRDYRWWCSSLLEKEDTRKS
jgi:hypothetical protein